MKRHLITLALLFAAVLAAPATASALGAWSQPAPGPLNVDPTQNAFTPSIASSESAPYVAWPERDAGGVSRIQVKSFADGAWSGLGGPVNRKVIGVDPSIAILSNGVPCSRTSICTRIPLVAWSGQLGTTFPVFVSRFDRISAVRSTWGQMGDPLITGAPDARPRITIDGETPYVVFTQAGPSGANEIVVDKFTGGAWVRVGGALDPGGQGFNPSIAVVAGVPYVAWREGRSTDATWTIRVARFTGGAWHALGGALNVDPAGGGADEPSIADIGGVPYVAFDEISSIAVGFATRVHVRRWSEESGWQTVGGPLNLDPDEEGYEPSIADIGGIPTVAWREASQDLTINRIDVKYWDPVRGEWSQIGGPLNVDPSHYATDPALAGVAGVPWVTWSENASAGSTGSFQIRVKRWEYVHYSVYLGPTADHRRNGTATQTMHVGASGRVLLFGKGVKRVRQNVKRGGTIKLEIVPKGSVAKRLKQQGKVTVSVTFRYFPSRGFPMTRTKAIALRRH
jgi:hypothetical protein